MLNAIILSEVNCVSDNTCTFLPKLWHLPLLPYLPQMCVCIVVCCCICCGRMLKCYGAWYGGSVVCVGKRAVLHCGVDVYAYVIKVAC